MLLKGRAGKVGQGPSEERKRILRNQFQAPGFPWSQGGRVMESELRVVGLRGEEGNRDVGRMDILPPEPKEY